MFRLFLLLFCKGFLFLFPYTTKVIILFYSANILADFIQKKIPTQTITAGGANTKQKKVWNKETYRRYIVNYELT